MSLQILSIIVILLVLVGVPTQFATMLGIVGAGLTVALKDFIVAFIGWLVLMGKNGMRLGDWVEINGVSGEVIELGMFHTVLLETGNWSDAGHPTGGGSPSRTASPSAAITSISRHRDNGCGTRCWWWVPFERDASPIADALYKEVVETTTDSSKQAEQEWRASAPNRRGAQITATPASAYGPRPAAWRLPSVTSLALASDSSYGQIIQIAVDLLGQGAQAHPASA